MTIGLMTVSPLDGGRSLEFRFLGGTNLPSRDIGHMDSMVMRIDGPDRFTSRWTWYASGVSKWTEEIVRVRVPEQQALALARTCPHLRHGGSILVRPVDPTER